MMKRYKMLLDYLERYKSGGLGWKTAYWDELRENSGCEAAMTGHVNGLLDDLIKIYGVERCIRIVKDFDWIDGRVYHATRLPQAPPR